MSVTLAVQIDMCPSLFNPFAGTKHFTAQKAWDVFALHQCGVPFEHTLGVFGGPLDQVLKTLHTCKGCDGCVMYTPCPEACVLPKYFDDPSPVWPVEVDTTPSNNWLKKQNKKQNKLLLKTGTATSVSTQSLSSLCKQLMKKNKTKKTK
jgi:hypothetical protein